MSEIHKNVEPSYGEKIERANSSEKADFSHLRKGDLLRLDTPDDTYYLAVSEGMSEGRGPKVCFYSDSDHELKNAYILGSSFGGSSVSIENSIFIGQGLILSCYNRANEFMEERVTPKIESVDIEYSSDNAVGMLKEDEELTQKYLELSEEERDGESFSFLDAERGDMIVVKTQNTTYNFIAVKPAGEKNLEVLVNSNKDLIYRKAVLQGTILGQDKFSSGRPGRIVKGLHLEFYYPDTVKTKGSIATSGVVSVEKIPANDDTEKILETDGS